MTDKLKPTAEPTQTQPPEGCSATEAGLVCRLSKNHAGMHTGSRFGHDSFSWMNKAAQQEAPPCKHPRTLNRCLDCGEHLLDVCAAERAAAQPPQPLDPQFSEIRAMEQLATASKLPTQGTDTCKEIVSTVVNYMLAKNYVDSSAIHDEALLNKIGRLIPVTRSSLTSPLCRASRDEVIDAATQFVKSLDDTGDDREANENHLDSIERLCKAVRALKGK